MKITIPEKFMGVPVEGAMERALKDESLEEEREIPVNSFSAEGFIYIPSANLHFARQKTHFGKNWSKTHESLSKERLAMPNLLEFAQTLKYLRDSQNLEDAELYNEITQVRSPWRATWLDAYFEKRKDGFYILTGNKAREEKLDKDTLLKDRRISLDSWIKNPTNQGLPKKDIVAGDLHYWGPRDNSVAGFNADSGRVLLACLRDPSNRNSSLGVFGVAEDKGSLARQGGEENDEQN